MFFIFLLTTTRDSSWWLRINLFQHWSIGQDLVRRRMNASQELDPAVAIGSIFGVWLNPGPRRERATSQYHFRVLAELSSLGMSNGFTSVVVSLIRMRNRAEWGSLLLFLLLQRLAKMRASLDRPQGLGGAAGDNIGELEAGGGGASGKRLGKLMFLSREEELTVHGHCQGLFGQITFSSLLLLHHTAVQV